VTVKKQQYIDKLDSIAARYGKMEDQTIRRSISMLKDLRRQIAAELATAENFSAYRLGELNRSLERLIAEYEVELTAQVRGAFEQAVADGAQSVVEPLRSIGLTTAFYQPSRAQINTVLDFSVDLIKNIADEVRSKVNTQIRLAVLGERSPLDAMRGITDALGVEARAGVWAKRKPVVKGVAARAEADLRTEMQRVFNLSSHAQQRDTARVVPGLLKRWISAGGRNSRESHLRLHHETRINPIPISKPFVMRDQRGTAKLMYPGDPSAPAWAVVNCRCRMATIHPTIGVIGSNLDGRIAAELERR